MMKPPPEPADRERIRQDLYRREIPAARPWIDWTGHYAADRRCGRCGATWDALAGELTDFELLHSLCLDDRGAA
jgi:hypothetical protein